MQLRCKVEKKLPKRLVGAKKTSKLERIHAVIEVPSGLEERSEEKINFFIYNKQF